MVRVGSIQVSMVTEEVEHTVGKSLGSNKNIPEPDIP